MILIDLDQSRVSQHCNNMIIAGNNPTAGILCSVCDAQIDSSTYCLVINFNSHEANLLFWKRLFKKLEKQWRMLNLEANLKIKNDTCPFFLFCFCLIYKVLVLSWSQTQTNCLVSISILSSLDVLILVGAVLTAASQTDYVKQTLLMVPGNYFVF